MATLDWTAIHYSIKKCVHNFFPDFHVKNSNFSNNIAFLESSVSIVSEAWLCLMKPGLFELYKKLKVAYYMAWYAFC